MSRFRTLRGRLSALALLATTIAVAVLVLGFNLILAGTLRSDVDSRLRTQAAAAATTVHAEPAGLTMRESPNDGALDARVWVFEGSRAIERPPAQPAVARAARELAGRTHEYLHVDEPGTKLYALALTHGGRRVGTVVTAESLAAYDRTTAIALTASLALGTFVLIAVYAVTWLTIGRALRPVTEMTRTAAAWSESELDRRFGPEPRPDELGRLAATFDALLDRLAASLRHEQRLSAELSHELRTPLARIAAETELLQRRERSAGDRAAAFEVIGRSAEQMRRILDMLMAAARAEAGTQRGRSPLAPTLSALAADWSAQLAERGVELAVEEEADGLQVGADAEVIERVIAPLLDNAGRYARSRVTIEAGRAAGRVVVRVRDDGPGIDPGAEEAIFEPGRRGAGANGHAGAGLGLALARRLARAAGGEVTAAAGGPGATFVIDLPA
jgi:signal transduction histidine kinase